MATRRYHGQKPRWADPNVEHRESLQRNLLRTPPAADPVGAVAQARGREASEDYIREQEEADPFYRLSPAGMAQSAAAAQLNSTQWGGYLQSLKDAAQRIAGPRARLRLAGGESPEGSTQIRGESVQPDYLGGRATPGGIAGTPDWWIGKQEENPSIQTIQANMNRMPASLHGLYAADFAPKKRR